ncbi:MAG TPA: DnaA N-terminal domain-containing protein [Ureibacillus sp.]|nr:DnaA N-terminal domain-containing protein [Ureibacillus sp.]
MDHWNAVLKIIAGKISQPSFETWLKATRAEITDNNTVIVYGPNSFAVEWLKTHYSDLIIQTLEKVTGQAYTVEIKTATKDEREEVITYSTNSLETKNYDESELNTLKSIISQQSATINNQQRTIDDLDKRVTILELKLKLYLEASNQETASKS